MFHLLYYNTLQYKIISSFPTVLGVILIEGWVNFHEKNGSIFSENFQKLRQGNLHSSFGFKDFLQ